MQKIWNKELEADDKARALHLRPYIAVGTKAGSTDLENAEKTLPATRTMQDFLTRL